MTEFFSEHISAAKHVKTQAMESREEEAGFQAIEARFKADVYGALCLWYRAPVTLCI